VQRELIARFLRGRRIELSRDPGLQPGCGRNVPGYLSPLSAPARCGRDWSKGRAGEDAERHMQERCALSPTSKRAAVAGQAWLSY